MALSRGIARGNWIRSLWAEAVYEDYDLHQDFEYRRKVPLIAAIDNKPIYDHVHADGAAIKDKRMAIDMLLVKRDIARDNIILRWIDTKQMLCDCMTKTSVPPDLLRAVLKSSKYSCGRSRCLEGEGERAQEQSSTQKAKDITSARSAEHQHKTRRRTLLVVWWYSSVRLCFMS